MKKSSYNIGYILFLAVVAACGGFLFGYDTAVISGTIKQVTTLFGLNDIEQGWYVGCALVGSIAGVAVAGTMSDWIGRRLTMIFASIMFSVSAIGCALCGSYQWLVFYRIVGGIGIGIVSIVSPMYISEIAVTEYRGRLVSLYQLAITVGFLGAYLINYWLLSVSESTRFDSELMNWIFVDEVWRGMLGMETLPALLFFIILFIIPESPRWLLLRGKVARSESIFGKIYSRKERAKKQVEELQAHIANETKSEFKYLFQPGILTAVVAGLCIAILGQFMGVNAVLDGIDEAIGEVEERDQVKAEALALRGYYYFMLVNLYGEPYNYNKQALGVPLKLTADMETNGTARSTVEEVYKQIVSDLKAASDLFEKYPKRRGSYRINLPTTNILLSRVYLHMELWDDAIAAATKAIENGGVLTNYVNLESSSTCISSYNYSEVEWVYGNGNLYLVWLCRQSCVINF